MNKETFCEQFIALAEEHYQLLKKKNYSKRTRVNKKLLEMLSSISIYFVDIDEFIRKIITTKNESAILWISNYALYNELCRQEIIKELEYIYNNSNDSIHSASAYTILLNNKVNV